MSTRSILFSSIHLLVVLFVLLIGVFLIIASYIPHFQIVLVEGIVQKPYVVFSCGLLIIVSGLLMTLGFYTMYRKRYLSIRMGCAKTWIEDSIVKGYVKEYWKKLMEGKEVDIDVIIGPQGVIEVITELPLHCNDIEELLEQVKRELGSILAHRFGYEKEFVLTLLKK